MESLRGAGLSDPRQAVPLQRSSSGPQPDGTVVVMPKLPIDAHDKLAAAHAMFWRAEDKVQLGWPRPHRSVPLKPISFIIVFHSNAAGTIIAAISHAWGRTYSSIKVDPLPRLDT
jgi:hypothetical protein